ncbi:MAG: hypothetical protein ABEJ48_01730 [Halobacteriales archaeon]
MPPIPRSTFRRRLNTLDAPDLAAFVRDLWAARGFEATVDDETVRVERPSTDAEARTFVIRRVPSLLGRFTVPWNRSIASPDRDDACIVTNAPTQAIRRELDDDITIIDADDLYDIAFYAIPREQCSALLDDHLDITDVTVPPADRSAGPASDRRTIHVAVWVLVGVIVLGLVAGGLLTTGIGARSSLVSSDATIDSVTPLPATDTPAPSTVTATSSMSMLAPGVTRDGQLNPARLAAAHEDAITGRAYTWTLTYREYGPNQTVIMNETVRVSTPTFYLITVDRNGEPLLPTPISDREVYANTRMRYERILTADAVQYQERPIDGHSRVAGRNANRAETYIIQYLSGDSSMYAGIESRGDRTLFILKTTGDPRPEITNATTIAWIDDTGLVYELRRQHQPAGRADVTVEITWKYTRIGNTTVSPPSWFTKIQSGAQ